jgi:hypothetical protein
VALTARTGSFDYVVVRHAHGSSAQDDRVIKVNQGRNVSPFWEESVPAALRRGSLDFVFFGAPEGAPFQGVFVWRDFKLGGIGRIPV